MFRILFIILLLASPLIVSAQNAVVSDSVKLTSTAGEAQSTVVPPNKKMEKCKQGRVLITNDRKGPPDNDVVTGQDLDKPGITASTSKFDMGTVGANFDPDFTKSKYWFGTNDHDLLTLANGDVLYITGAFSRMPMSSPRAQIQLANPKWFADTFRCMKADNNGKCLANQAFGPGARTVVMVFRSTDCGENFTYVSQMDPMHVGGGLCALPQFRRNWSLKTIPQLFEKPWDMGGSDGQLAKVDPATNRVYMTFQCVGYNAVDAKAKEFVLDQNNKINKTLVMMMDPAVNFNWKNLGYIDQAAWRFSFVPVAGDELDFGFASSVLFGKKDAAGKYTFDSTGIPAPNGSNSWMGEWNFKDSSGNSKVPIDNIGSNVLAVPVISRTPDANILMLAFPDKFDSGWGYRVAFYDRVAKKITDASDADSIVPAKADTNNVVFHLAVADPGSGPVLLYWTDLDSAAKTVTVRGRLITGKGKFTDDFTISQTGGLPTSFALAGTNYWYGDYHTAGAYASKFSQTAGQGPFTVELANTMHYNYYPMWVEPTNVVRYARVEYSVRTDLMSVTSLKKVRVLKELTIPVRRWRPEPPPVELSRIRRPVRRLTQENEHKEDFRRPIVRPRP